MSGYAAFAQVYDKLTFNVDYTVMAERILALLQEFGCPHDLILDLGCGTGKLMSALAERGADVIGADRSEEMLAVARERLPNALLLCQPMQKLDLYGTVNAVVCTLDSLNHLLTLQGMKKAVERAGLFLEPGGMFIFDVNSPYKHEEILQNNTFVYDRPEVYCVWRNRLRHRTVDIRLDLFEKDGNAYRRQSDAFSERAYTDEEILEALSSAGLELVGRYDGYTDAPVSSESERIVYAARRIRPYGQTADSAVSESSQAHHAKSAISE